MLASDDNLEAGVIVITSHVNLIPSFAVRCHLAPLQVVLFTVFHSRAYSFLLLFPRFAAPVPCTTYVVKPCS